MTTTQAQKQRARDARNADIVGYWDATYGRNETKLSKWQALCSDCGVDEGCSITQCKKNLKRVYINIVDFVADQQAGRDVRIFRS